MNYALVQNEDTDPRWWETTKGNDGRWTKDPKKARRYSEHGAHIAWTAVSAKHNSVKCVQYPEVANEIWA